MRRDKRMLTECRDDGMTGWTEIVGVQRRVKDLASTYVLCPRLTDKYAFLFADDGRTEYRRRREGTEVKVKDGLRI
jgi:hypothetical protein